MVPAGLFQLCPSWPRRLLLLLHCCVRRDMGPADRRCSHARPQHTHTHRHTSAAPAACTATALRQTRAALQSCCTASGPDLRCSCRHPAQGPPGVLLASDRRHGTPPVCSSSRGRGRILLLHATCDLLHMPPPRPANIQPAAHGAPMVASPSPSVCIAVIYSSRSPPLARYAVLVARQSHGAYRVRWLLNAK